MLLEKIFKAIPYFSVLQRTAREHQLEVWLVGGCIRDAILGFPKGSDFDFVVSSDVERFTADFSRNIHGRLVILDKELRNIRIVKVHSQDTYHFDFSVLRSSNLFKDLAERDLSINALAIDIHDQQGRIIDPTGGIADIFQKKLRFISEKNICDDPLRILRIFSFAARLGFSIVPQSRKWVKLHKKKIFSVSAERIHEELCKILRTHRTPQVFQMMDSTGVLSVLIPEWRRLQGVRQGGYHHLDVRNHSQATLENLEEILRKEYLFPALKEFLAESVSRELSREHLLKIGALLHDIGKPKAKRRTKKRVTFYSHEKIGRDMLEVILKRLAFSNKEIEFLKTVVFFHLRPGYLAEASPLSRKAVFRFFRSSDPEGPSVLFLACADLAATKGRHFPAHLHRKSKNLFWKLLRGYFREKKRKSFPRFVNGHDIMKSCGISPSPLVGKTLFYLEELQHLGKIKNRKEAMTAAATFVKKHATEEC